MSALKKKTEKNPHRKKTERDLPPFPRETTGVYPVLDRVNTPEDVKALDAAEIPALCRDIRSFLVDHVSRSGGHLASNLGVVELTVAIHRVFDSPKDHILFDVGHQSYVHKILTGRKDRFDTLRTTGGLSGFTLRKESEHDPFGAGHSSTSVSAALGFAEADKLSESDAFTVAVLGDGAYTGGMVHEAMNNVRPDLRMILILNENRMSISRNRGAFASYLARVRISERYRRWKGRTKSVLRHIPLLGKPLETFMSAAKEQFKRRFYTLNYFEELGLYYLGPVDGNDPVAVERALGEAKRFGKNVLVHVITKKGKGYEPAERAPEAYHNVAAKQNAPDAFHTVFVEELCREAEEDPKIVAITAAMSTGTGLYRFGERFPDRYFDVGIAEEHALTFAAGLAAGGAHPYPVIYSTFLQRAYDNILHDVALQRLPVRMIIDRAGLAVADGATHHGIFDVAFLSEIPGVRILSPMTYGSLLAATRQIRSTEGPVALRYPNASEDAAVVQAFYPAGDYENFGVRTDFDGRADAVFVTYGPLVTRTLAAEALLRAEGISVGTVLLEELAPYDGTAHALLSVLSDADAVLFAEEGIKNGGAAMILKERLTDLGLPAARMAISAIDDTFASPDTPCDLYASLGLSPECLAGRMRELLFASRPEGKTGKSARGD